MKNKSLIADQKSSLPSPSVISWTHHMNNIASNEKLPHDKPTQKPTDSGVMLWLPHSHLNDRDDFPVSL